MLLGGLDSFYEEVGRFPGIDEDEPPLHLLDNEYPCPATDDMSRTV